MTDGEAIRRVLAGDVEVFSILVRTHHADCMSFARGMLGRKEPAEDVVQETFLRAYRGLGRYDDRGQFRAWLFRILINRCRTALARERRARARWIPLADLPPGSVPSVPPSDVFTRASVDAALGLLAGEQREAFLLRYVEQLSYEEISFVTGAGVSALKMRVARAKESLRHRYGDGSRKERGGCP
jgi:RNA polymerase sigma-70 factor (ECF subfamily)